jgi:hypothetical protein
MARGKYASSAEARRAREDAVTGLAAAQRKVAALEKENAEIRAAAAKSHAEHIEQMRQMQGALTEGISPEVEDLRAQLKDAEIAAVNAYREVALSIVEVFRSRDDFTATPEFNAHLSHALGITPAELLLRSPDGSRYVRRMTPRKLRQHFELADWAKSNGVPFA